MTYIIEIDNKTEASKKILSSVRKLQKQDSSIKITYKKEKFRPLTVKEMVLPGGPKPTREQLDEFLTRKEGDKVYTIEEVRQRLAKHLKNVRRK